MTRRQRDDIQRAIIYCRVSTDEQDNNTSLETQEADCREWAAAHCIELVAVVHESFTSLLLWERKELEFRQALTCAYAFCYSHRRDATLSH